MTRMQEVIEREAEYQRLSNEVRVAADRLNDAIANCTRAGVVVEAEVRPLADPGDQIIRNVVEVTPYVVVRY